MLFQIDEFQWYLSKRVEIVARGRGKKSKTFIGTLIAFDEHLNVVLADPYRVIMYSDERQRQDVLGVLFIRGSSVRSISLVEYERKLLKFPTSVKKEKKKKKKSAVPKKAEVPPPQTKPVKLKRTWLSTIKPESSNAEVTLAGNIKMEDESSSKTEDILLNILVDEIPKIQIEPSATPRDDNE